MKRTLITSILIAILALQGGGVGWVPERVMAFDLGYHNDKVDALQKQFDPANNFPYVWTKIQIGDMEVDIDTTLQLLFNQDARDILNRLHFDDHYNANSAESFKQIQKEWDWLGDLMGGILQAECGPNLSDDQLDRLLLKIGIGLHMVEDFYSHSNYVELLDALGPALPTWDDLNQEQKNALTNGVNVNPPQGGQLPPGQTPLYTGAYKNSPTPPQLTHEKLNKDSPGSQEGRVNALNHPQNTYFDIAYDLAVRASVQWMNKFKAWMGNDCWNQVLSYHPGFCSKIGIQIKWGESKLAGVVSGHWKSGEPKSVYGSLSRIDLGYSPSYPDADPTALVSARPTYTYQVQNLGATPVNSLHIQMASGGGHLVASVTSPPGWTWQLSGDSLDFQTNVASLGPDAAATFSLSCDSCAIREAEAVLGRTDGSVDGALDIVGPGPMSDIMLEEASILSEMGVVPAVVTGANFQITSFSITPPAPDVGAPVTISATVQNNGTDEGIQDVTVRIKLGATVLKEERRTTPLNPAGSTVITVSYAFATAGTYTVEVATDNDSRSQTVTVGGGPPPSGGTIEGAVAALVPGDPSGAANPDLVIGDQEILQAISFWINGEPVPGTAGKTINDAKMLELISLWIGGTPVAASAAGLTATGIERKAALTVNKIAFTGSRFIVQGSGIESMAVQVWDLAGRPVFANTALGNALDFKMNGPGGAWLANGVYLYTVTVRSFDGSLVRSAVRKLVVLR